MSGTSKKLTPEMERLLAKMLMDEASQLEERAKEYGVTAYCQRPLKRERPNERFLQNTLKSVQSANRKAQERELWAAWERRKAQEGQGREAGTSDGNRAKNRGDDQHDDGQAQQRGELSQAEKGAENGQSSKRAKTSTGSYLIGGISGGVENSQSPMRSSSSPDDRSLSSGQSLASTELDSVGGQGMADADLQTFLLKRRKWKGRGDVGPRADLPGPYLPDQPGIPDTRQRAPTGVRVPQGPTRPPWMSKPDDTGMGTVQELGEGVDMEESWVKSSLPSLRAIGASLKCRTASEEIPHAPMDRKSKKKKKKKKRKSDRSDRKGKKKKKKEHKEKWTD